MRQPTFLTFALFAVAACAGGPPSDASAKAIPRPSIDVRTADARPLVRAGGLTYVGVVVAERDVLLAAPLGGRLEQLSVDVGERVERGQLLAKVRDEDAALATMAASAAAQQSVARLGGASSPAGVPEVAAARAQLEASADQRKRTESLAEKGAASAQDLVRVRAQETSARAQLDAATALAVGAFAEAQRAHAAAARERASLRDTAIRAPFAGIVAERFVRASETVAPSGAVLRVVDPASVRVEIEVPQHEHAAIEADRVVWIDDERAASALRGHVVRVGPVFGSSRTRKVIASVEADAARALIPGARVHVRVESGAPETLVAVPRAAVRSFGGASRAFVVGPDRRVTERLLDVAGVEPDAVLVAEAVKPGDAVVLEPPLGLRDGDEVSR
ncbi:MAG: efflux RND transporter periplasmic adaptor subunit [Deltaproteobacteria bacterium]|nr:efflux RND transporter periplasmic adaptor subunit [Deltaproteobacteria bacterium]